MSIRFLKLSLASPECIRSWTERILPNGKRVGKILKGDLIDYKNGLPIRDGLSCERIFGPMVSFTCTCGRFKCIETRGIHIVHDTLRSSRLILPDTSRETPRGADFNVKQWGERDSVFSSSTNSRGLEIPAGGDLGNTTVSQNTISQPVKKLVDPHRFETGSNSNQKSFKSAEKLDYQPIIPPPVRSQAEPEKKQHSNRSLYKDTEAVTNLYNEQSRSQQFVTDQLFQTKSLQSGILQSIGQKKMIRFLSEFYYDYQLIYHSKKKIIPSFISILQEPYTIPLTNESCMATSFYKQQILGYYWPKSNRFESSNWFSLIGNKQTVRLKIDSSRVQSLLKPLDNLLFQIYIRFWFDLKVHHNNSIYEKHIFSWVSPEKYKTQKTMLFFKTVFGPDGKKKSSQWYNSKHNQSTQKFTKNLPVYKSLQNRFTIRGLSNTSLKLPIIGIPLTRYTTVHQTKNFRRSHLNKLQVISTGIIHHPAARPPTGANKKHENFGKPVISNTKSVNELAISRFRPCGDLKHQCLNFSSLSYFLLINHQWPDSFFNKTIPNHIFLPETKSFFRIPPQEQKTLHIPSTWYNVFISQNRFCIESGLSPCRGVTQQNFKFWYLKYQKFLGLTMSPKQLIQYNNSQIFQVFILGSAAVKTRLYKNPKGYTDVGFRVNSSKIQDTRFFLDWLKITMNFQKICSLKDICLNKTAVFWSQTKYNCKLPERFQQSIKPPPGGLKKIPAGTDSPSRSNSKNASTGESFSIIALYFAVNPKFYLSIGSQTKPAYLPHQWEKSKAIFYELAVQPIFQKLSLALKKNCGSKLIPETLSTRSRFSNTKNTEESFVFSRSQLLQGQNKAYNPATSLPSAMKPETWRKPITIFDFFKKQEIFAEAKIPSCLPGNSIPKFSPPQERKSRREINPFLNESEYKSTVAQPVLSSTGADTSWTPSSQIQETFSGKPKADQVPISLTTDSNSEEISKSYLGANPKPNIRVYKFKNFPPEEIRYCPYCEVELLPNSIRRYRLGYIEFVSPVTHIWYTATGIPLLLNISKTMIEGIASCHEALSSGFPPVYKWSYNGESPTSWTFQMQPLKLPVNLVPKIVSYNKYTDSCDFSPGRKKSYSTEIIFGSNSMIYPSYQNPDKAVEVRKPLLKIIPRKLISSDGERENNFTMYQKLIPSVEPKTLTIHDQKKINNESHKGSKNPRRGELIDNNPWWLSNISKTVLKLSDFATFALTPAGTDSFLANSEKTAKNVCDLSKNENGKTRWFLPFSNSINARVSNTPAGAKNPKTNRVFTNSHQQLPNSLFNHNSSIMLNSHNPPLWTQENFTGWAPCATRLIDKKNTTSRLLRYGSNILNFPPQGPKAFYHHRCFFKINWFTCIRKKPFDQSFKKARGATVYLVNDQPRSRCFFYKNIEIVNRQKISAGSVTNEIMGGFPFFHQVPKTVNSSYDPFTASASEYEKKREWLKLEGFFEDLGTPRRGELPFSSERSAFPDVWKNASFNKPNKLNESLNGKPPEDSANQKPETPSKFPNYVDHNSAISQNFMTGEEIRGKNENDDSNFDNLSSPLVLPFLGKNPDNIEFRSDYSNYEHFNRDPLKFLIDLYTTQHIWGESNFDPREADDNPTTNSFNTIQPQDNQDSSAMQDPMNVSNPPLRRVAGDPHSRFRSFSFKNTERVSSNCNPTRETKENLYDSENVQSENELTNDNSQNPEKIAYHQFFGVTTRHLGYVGNDIWNHVSIADNNPISRLEAEVLNPLLRTDCFDILDNSPHGQIIPTKSNFLKNPRRGDLLKELQCNFSLFLKDKVHLPQGHNFWGSSVGADPSYIIEFSLFSKTDPFLPPKTAKYLNDYNRINNSQNGKIHPPKNPIGYTDGGFRANNNTMMFTDLKPAIRHDDSKQMILSKTSETPTINNPEAPILAFSTREATVDFRNFGRNAYYFKLEVMARCLENTFLKTLFYRNKFHKTLLCSATPAEFSKTRQPHGAEKKSISAPTRVPLTRGSIYYSTNYGRWATPAGANKILFQTIRTNKINPNFTIGKKTRFLFGFHLNTYSFNFWKYYLAKIQYPPFYETNASRFSSVSQWQADTDTKYNFPVYIPLIKTAPIFSKGVAQRENFAIRVENNTENSLYPLFSNTKTGSLSPVSDPAISVNDLNNTFHETVENIHQFWLPPENNFPMGDWRCQKNLRFINNPKTQLNKLPLRDSLQGWTNNFLNKETVHFFKKNREAFPLLFLYPVFQTQHREDTSNKIKPADSLFKTTLNRETVTGIPVSILYDFNISPSFSATQNLPYSQVMGSHPSTFRINSHMLEIPRGTDKIKPSAGRNRPSRSGQVFSFKKPLMGKPMDSLVIQTRKAHVSSAPTNYKKTWAAARPLNTPTNRTTLREFRAKKNNELTRHPNFTAVYLNGLIRPKTNISITDVGFRRGDLTWANNHKAFKNWSPWGTLLKTELHTFYPRINFQTTVLLNPRKHEKNCFSYKQNLVQHKIISKMFLKGLSSLRQKITHSMVSGQVNSLVPNKKVSINRFLYMPKLIKPGTLWSQFIPVFSKAEIDSRCATSYLKCSKKNPRDATIHNKRNHKSWLFHFVRSLQLSNEFLGFSGETIATKQKLSPNALQRFDTTQIEFFGSLKIYAKRQFLEVWYPKDPNSPWGENKISFGLKNKQKPDSLTGVFSNKVENTDGYRFKNLRSGLEAHRFSAPTEYKKRLPLARPPTEWVIFATAGGAGCATVNFKQSVENLSNRGPVDAKKTKSLNANTIKRVPQREKNCSSRFTEFQEGYQRAPISKIDLKNSMGTFFKQFRKLIHNSEKIQNNHSNFAARLHTDGKKTIRGATVQAFYNKAIKFLAPVEGHKTGLYSCFYLPVRRSYSGNDVFSVTASLHHCCRIFNPVSPTLDTYLGPTPSLGLEWNDNQNLSYTVPVSSFFSPHGYSTNSFSTRQNSKLEYPQGRKYLGLCQNQSCTRILPWKSIFSCIKNVMLALHSKQLEFPIMKIKLAETGKYWWFNHGYHLNPLRLRKLRIQPSTINNLNQLLVERHKNRVCYAYAIETIQNKKPVSKGSLESVKNPAYNRSKFSDYHMQSLSSKISCFSYIGYTPMDSLKLGNKTPVGANLKAKRWIEKGPVLKKNPGFSGLNLSNLPTGSFSKENFSKDVAQRGNFSKLRPCKKSHSGFSFIKQDFTYTSNNKTTEKYNQIKNDWPKIIMQRISKQSLLFQSFDFNLLYLWKYTKNSFRSGHNSFGFLSRVSELYTGQNRKHGEESVFKRLVCHGLRSGIKISQSVSVKNPRGANYFDIKSKYNLQANIINCKVERLPRLVMEKQVSQFWLMSLHRKFENGRAASQKPCNANKESKTNQTPILKWGTRGHSFRPKNPKSYTDVSFNRDPLALPRVSGSYRDKTNHSFFGKSYNGNNASRAGGFINQKPNPLKNTQPATVESLAKTNDNSLITDDRYNQLNEKRFEDYSNLPINEKLKTPAGSGNTNYYACISQITSWGSDHGSWILFLKYIRANIYKGDQLLPLDFNKMNFQMMPRTGSIMLQQLLSQLCLVPRVEKPKSTVETHTAPKFSPILGGRLMANNDKRNNTITRESIKNPAGEQNLSLGTVASQYFKYNSSFLRNEPQNSSLAVQPLQKTIQRKLSNRFSLSPRDYTGQQKKLIDRPNVFSRLATACFATAYNKTLASPANRVRIANQSLKSASVGFSRVVKTHRAEIKPNTRYTNKYVFNAYKIKKPMSHKRFTQIYQDLNVVPTIKKDGNIQLKSRDTVNNWYRLNNFFAYVQPTSHQVETQTPYENLMNIHLLENQTDRFNESVSCIPPLQGSTGKTRQGEKFYRDKEKTPTYLKEFSPTMIGNDTRILKLMYSLIISFQNSFLPTAKKEPVNPQVKPSTNRFQNQRSLRGKKLFNQSFYSPVLNGNRRIFKKSAWKTTLQGFSWVPIYTNPRRGGKPKYHIFSVLPTKTLRFAPWGVAQRQGSQFYPLVKRSQRALIAGKKKPKIDLKSFRPCGGLNPRKGKDSFLQFLFRPHGKFKSRLIDKNTTQAINWYPTYKISNSYYHIYSPTLNENLRPRTYKLKTRQPHGANQSKNLTHEFYSLKSKAISKLALVKLNSLKNHYPAVQPISFLSCLISRCATLSINNNKTGTQNVLSTSHFKQNPLSGGERENFYFSNQKTKIYNILVSPLEISEFQSEREDQFLNPPLFHLYESFSSVKNTRAAATPYRVADFEKSELSKESFRPGVAQRDDKKALPAVRPINAPTAGKSVKTFWALNTLPNTLVWGNQNYGWGYSKLIDRSISDIKPYQHAIDKTATNFQNKSVAQLGNTRNNQHQHLFQTESKRCKSNGPVLPINFNTYQGQIQGEALFIKNREIGNHNVLVKKKNTVFKSLILKMNSSLQPLLSLTPRITLVGDGLIAGANETINPAARFNKQINFDKNPIKLLNTQEISNKISARTEKNYGSQPFMNSKPNRVYLTKGVWSKSRGVAKREKTENTAVLFNTDTRSATPLPQSEFFKAWLFLDSIHYSHLHGFNNLCNQSKQHPPLPENRTPDLISPLWTRSNSKLFLHQKRVSPKLLNTCRLSVANQDYFSKILQFYEYRKNFLLKKIFKQRLALTVSNTPIPFMSPYQKPERLYSGETRLTTAWVLEKCPFTSGHAAENKKPRRGENYDPSIKLNITKFLGAAGGFNHSDRDTWNCYFIDSHYLTRQNSTISPSQIVSTPSQSFAYRETNFPITEIMGYDRCAFCKKNPPIDPTEWQIFSQSPNRSKYCGLFFPVRCVVPQWQNKSFKIGLVGNRLLKRRIENFYDQESDLKIKYEFKPFGPQIRTESTYDNWKNFRPWEGFKLPPGRIFDLENSNPSRRRFFPAGRIKFRLLTVPRGATVFDPPPQGNSNNLLNRMPLPKTLAARPFMNYLGPLFFSSMLKPNSKKLAFPLVNGLKNQPKPFWNSAILTTDEQYFEKLEYDPNYTETFSLNNRPLSSETLFREENLKVSSSYKALLKKAKILEDYPVPDPDPIDSNSTGLRLLNCGLPRPVWWNLQTPGNTKKFRKHGGLPLIGASLTRLDAVDNKSVDFSGLQSVKNKNTRPSTPPVYKSITADQADSPPVARADFSDHSKAITPTSKLPSLWIWDGNQNKFKNYINKPVQPVNPEMTHNLPQGGKTSNDAFSMRDLTKLETNRITNPNNSSQLLLQGQNGYLHSKNTRVGETVYQPKPEKVSGELDFFSNNTSLQGDSSTVLSGENQEFTSKNLPGADHFRVGSSGLSSDLPATRSFPTRGISSRRSGFFNSTRNLRKLRLQYLRNFRRLRFIEYLKATYIKPEWMILSLLPVLPPDLRPVIANPRGYITGDINTHYQNVIYRNNNIEKLLDTFWIPRKFYSKISFFNHQKATRLMLSNFQSYLHSVYYLPTPRGAETKSLKLRRGGNMYPVSKAFSKLAGVELPQSRENNNLNSSITEKRKTPVKYPEYVFSSPAVTHRLRYGTIFPFNRIHTDKTKLFNGELERIISPAFSKFTTTIDFNPLPDQPRELKTLHENNHTDREKFQITNSFVTKKIMTRWATPVTRGLNKNLSCVSTLSDGEKVYPWNIAEAFRKSKMQKLPHPRVGKQVPFLSEVEFDTIYYKPLLKFSNHQAERFFGSNIGIATGYNEIVSAHQLKQLDHESTLQPSEMSDPLLVLLKNNAVPSLALKIFRTQALHDSKPLQEMQYSLQKAVDALIDNSQKLQSNVLLRKGRPLKSLSDNLKGKEGRFRQHLLGKRVDYSGRSVIVVGPELKLYECGIPLIMALRLFQPFLILYLIYRFKIASLLATQLIQRKHPMVINLLKKFIETWPILLNRAPTLHRMNIQAFKIRLVQGKAILLHPLVCSSYNADFDGDQMGVHVPITQQARAESWKLLWSINNSIGLASRQPLFLPSQDMVIGNYYLTAPPINNNNASHRAMSKTPWPANVNIQNSGFSSGLYAVADFYKFAQPQNTAYHNTLLPTVGRGELTKNSGFGYAIEKVSPGDQRSIDPQEWSNDFIKMNPPRRGFFSLEEAYQYYLNTAYRFHVNTPVWFYFNMLFETSEREKAIEITIDKNGNNKIITKYYEKQLKRNRVLGKNAFYFSTHLNSSITRDNSCRGGAKLIKPGSVTRSISESSVQKRVSNKNPNGADYFSNMHNIKILPLQTIFNRNLSPILINQIIRSTFGRIEFYYEAFCVSRLEFTKTNQPSKRL